MAVPIQHPLFELIRDEHAKIASLIKTCIEENLSLDSLQKLFLFAEKQHHFNEEELLFNTVSQDPRLLSGGPLCMFYMDDYILNHPVENLSLKTGLKIDIPQRLAHFYDTGSNLRIPLNEHLVCGTLLSALITHYASHSETHRQTLFNIYRQIQSNNKSKEENCFLHMCSSLLSESQADEILKKWSSLEL